MNESLLNALIKLFAIIVDVKHFRDPHVARSVIEKYFTSEYGRTQGKNCAIYFDEHLRHYHHHINKNETKDITVYDDRINEICSEINLEFEQKQKIWLCLQLIEFLNESNFAEKEELLLTNRIAASFNIDADDFEQAKNMILSDINSIKLTEKMLIIDGNSNFLQARVKHIYKPKMKVRIYVLQLKRSDIYLFKYGGEQNLFLNGLNIAPGKAYVWGMGAVIWGSRIKQVYYSEIVNAFSFKANTSRIEFIAKGVSYNFFNSKNGLKEFDLEAQSGQLIGIVGGSGSGKSTFLNVLNGNLTAKTGKICINGYDIHKDKNELEGIIGYVPQEDLLLEELTVYQNLYYNAKLCFSDYSEEQIDVIVTQTIADFDLKEATDLKVGDPINKILSGGQRKRLNIALELMREPALLFADEPTSGLSSMDSEKIINLLKKQTFKDKLVVLTIHQPSSDIYKLFDRIIVIDQGGRMIFSGNPLDAVSYFRKNANFINPQETECVTCGNIKSEQILQIVEARLVNEFGKLTRKRKRHPEEWEEIYKKETRSKIIELPKEKKELPATNFKTPGRFKQFKIYLKRNLKSKLSNNQYVLLLLFEAPILALILGWFTKDFNGPESNPDKYIFANNENLPAYIFMSVVVALFLGMIISAEEIIRDRKIIKRESFLNLSRFSYINSKALLLAGISAIQALLFVLIGNFILEIRGLTFDYWFMFFSTAVCANLIGLNISATFNTVVSSYIAIPFILVPQLLLSGVVVDFNKIHKHIKADDCTPIIGDIMTSRWAYEGLVVEQFKNNPFQKHFFDVEERLSQANYLNTFYRQKIKSIYTNLIINEDNSTETTNKIKLLKNELYKLADKTKLDSFISLADKLEKDFRKDEFKNTFENSFEELEKHLLTELEENKRIKEEIYNQLVSELGSTNNFLRLQQNNHNKAIANIVKNRFYQKKIKANTEKIIQVKDPIYRIPESKIGRAHFFAPVKRIGNLYIDTYWFNLIVIWMMTAGMYVLLHFDILRRGLVIMESIIVTKGWSKKALRV